MTYPEWTAEVDWPNAPTSLINQPPYPPLYDLYFNHDLLATSLEFNEIETLLRGDVSGFRFNSQVWMKSLLINYGGGSFFYKSGTLNRWNISDLEAVIGYPFPETSEGDPLSASELNWWYRAFQLLKIFQASDNFDGTEYNSSVAYDLFFRHRWVYWSGSILSIASNRLIVNTTGLETKLTSQIDTSPLPHGVRATFSIKKMDTDQRVQMRTDGASLLINAYSNELRIAGPYLGFPSILPLSTAIGVWDIQVEPYGANTKVYHNGNLLYNKDLGPNSLWRNTYGGIDIYFFRQPGSSASPLETEFSYIHHTTLDGRELHVLP